MDGDTGETNHSPAAGLSEEDVGRVLDSLAGTTLRVVEGRIEGASGTATLGYAPDALLGEPVERILAATVPPGFDADVTDGETFTEIVQQGDADDVTVPFEATDGTVVSMSVTAVSATDAPGVVCLCEERDRDTSDPLDEIPDPAYVLDTAGRFERVNDALVTYTGYDRAELIGRRMDELIPAGAEDRLPPDDGRGTETFETKLATKGGEVLVFEGHATGNDEDPGESTGTVCVLREISERARRERDLERLKQVLTRVFRHNFRNELMVAKGLAQQLEARVDEDFEQYTEKIVAAVERVQSHGQKARRIEEVFETEELIETDLSAIVETAREAHPDAAIAVDVPDTATVEAHPRIESAVAELLDNAVEHAPDDQQPRVRVWIDDREGTTTLFVEDESGGLSQDEITVLRRGNETALEHSSGVGLWLVRWIVEYSGAELIVHRTGAGSLIGIRFSRHAKSDEQTIDVGDSPIARPPKRVRETTTERFRGETVVGRIDARRRLEDIYDDLSRSGGHAVLITGEAGIGKTTIVDQFLERVRWSDDDTTVATGYCRPDDQPPYHAFRKVLEDLPGERDAPDLLADVESLDADDAETLAQRKRALFADVADQFRSQASEGPVVVVVEDMHWADSGTMSLFEYLLEEVGQWGHQVLFVGTYRTSDVDESHPVVEVARETAAAGRGSLIELDSFDVEAVASLFSEILGVEELPSSFVEAVHDHTGGTPLFVTELGEHLAQTFGPITSPDQLPTTLAEVTVPETVERAITERLADLPESAATTLRLGAVVGTEFSFDVLRAASDCPVQTLIDRIEVLVRREVWTRTGDEIAFVHGIVREQTLDSIDDDQRAALHAEVAEAIERVHGDASDEYASRLASHCAAAGDYAAAVDYYRRAGDHAFDTYATETALEHYQRALELATAHGVGDDVGLSTLCADIGEVRVMTGAVDSAREVLQRGFDRAPEDSRAVCRLLDVQSRAEYTQSEFTAAAESARRQRELAASLGDRRLEASAVATLGLVAEKQSDFDRASDHHERSLDIYREVGDLQGEAAALRRLGTIALHGEQFDRAREYYERGLDLHREIGDSRGRANNLHNLGVVAEQRGDYSAATDYYEQSLSVFQEIGDRTSEASTLHNLGEVAFKRGAYDRARSYHERALQLLREIGNTRGEATSLRCLGSIDTRCSQYDRARDRLESALELIEELALPPAKINVLRELAALARETGAYETAQARLDDGVAICEDIHHPHHRAEFQLERARLALERGDTASAREHATGARQTFADVDATHHEARAEIVLGRVAAASGATDEAVDRWTTALDTVEEIGAPQDALEALRLLSDATRDRDDDRTQVWLERARELLETAPDPVAENNRAWVQRLTDVHDE